VFGSEAWLVSPRVCKRTQKQKFYYKQGCSGKKIRVDATKTLAIFNSTSNSFLNQYFMNLLFITLQTKNKA